MNRSEINRYIEEAISFFDKFYFRLPPWAYFSPDDWKDKGIEYLEIKENMLGWDLTDFGSGNFEKTGLLLFTLRNGKPGHPIFRKTYAEKIMIVRDRQVTPTHFHWQKMEDIINRGGGRLCIQLWKSNSDENLSNESFTVQVDGVTHRVGAGDIIRLKPGESICLEPYVYHKFWAENGITMVGEVSMVNNDVNDNRFLEPVGRFPEITEDEPAQYLLCTEYPELK
ncbi:MAG: D-lyxose/D-mannose family sugar isomerase [Bacteroidales bacterium]|nr:D-lyxose/D-mannose family sugar isomerase [Bacteroidales bacterium]